MSRARTLALLCGSALLLGCATWRGGADLPVRHSLVRDQLVIHCDFKLPAHHRLLDELAAQRDDVSAKLRLPRSDEPIHVYLFDTAKRFHAFRSAQYPDFPARRAFFVETDTRLAVYAHWGDRVAEDLRHEVAHGYLHAVVPHLSLWLDEGLAEYFEVGRGTGGLNRAHVETLRRARREADWKPDLNRLEQLVSVADMTQLDYAEAWAWVHLMLESTPPRREALQQYLNTLRGGGTASSLWATLRNLQANPEAAFLRHLESLPAIQ